MKAAGTKPPLLSRMQRPPIAETGPILSSALPAPNTDLAEIASDLQVAKSRVAPLSVSDLVS